MSPDYLPRSHRSINTTKTTSPSCPPQPLLKARAPHHLCHTPISTGPGEAQLAIVATTRLGQTGRWLHVESPVDDLSPVRPCVHPSALSSSSTLPVLIATREHQTSSRGVANGSSGATKPVTERKAERARGCVWRCACRRPVGTVFSGRERSTAHSVTKTLFLASPRSASSIMPSATVPSTSRPPRRGLRHQRWSSARGTQQCPPSRQAPHPKQKKHVGQKSGRDRVNNRALSPLVSRIIGTGPTPKNSEISVLSHRSLSSLVSHLSYWAYTPKTLVYALPGPVNPVSRTVSPTASGTTRQRQACSH